VIKIDIMNSHPWWMWVGFLLLVGALLAFDLGLLHKKQKEIKVKEAMYMVIFYFILAMLFGLGIFFTLGQQSGYEFVVGYLIEFSLSIDNIFVFVLIFAHFGVPQKYQYRVLFWGILIAIVLRGAFIFAGSALIHKFDWILYVFGALLLITGIKMLIASGSEPDLDNNRLINFFKSRFRMTADYHGQSFFARLDGKLYATPLFLVFILINIADIVFAMDSVPAIFAITKDPFIIYTSNIFAILGLRSLYFALSAIIHRFHYLKYGISVVLVFIGFKMLINHYYAEKIISTELSLLVTLLLVIGSIVVSLFKTRHSKGNYMVGWVPGSRQKNKEEE